MRLHLVGGYAAMVWLRYATLRYADIIAYVIILVFVFPLKELAKHAWCVSYSHLQAEGVKRRRN